MSERLFSLQEALATLPAAARALLDIQEWKQELEERSVALEQVLNSTDGNGHRAGDIAEGRAAVQSAAVELDRAFRQMDALGVELKGIDNGLLDFPSMRNGRVVYLCWRQGEETIAYWHDVEAGFAGRQLL
ncbi:MAG: DUF2203 domain-containing protein [Dehalococcoidia bacterium]